MKLKGRVGGKSKTLDLSGLDKTRCKAWNRRGDCEQCALDVGHYRDRMHAAPSPHVAENGEEWF